MKKEGETEPKKGLKLFASTPDTVRAWPGGFGSAKLGANYGPSLQAHGKAQAQGFDQILWLFGEDRQVTEAGASNFFIIWHNADTGRLELVTAPLENQLILPGVTRRSVLELVRDRLSKQSVGSLQPLQVSERTLTILEIEKAAKEGRIVESFVSGTAVSFPVFFLDRRHLLTSFTVLHYSCCYDSQRRHRYQHSGPERRACWLCYSDKVLVGGHHVRQRGARMGLRR